MAQRKRRRLFGCAEAARKLGVSRRTVYRWIDAGRLKAVTSAAGIVKVPESEIRKIPKEEPMSDSRAALEAALAEAVSTLDDILSVVSDDELKPAEKVGLIAGLFEGDDDDSEGEEV
jgi:excisionase family DNA binding protein